ncbi:hypothetical protein A2Z22_00115 [Candidatus Woesebacteria bacterium RBG_16_34_12]|uniref:Uncharacterized protein n=1 Tax=Candidatus Woesebacteria bacterium RBG_16_34_12 TaxID=1802480 RepID=A0A1F7XA40_9BACT|nr:MAG: hypothetical protein A2Z22_00115 [Candidatus Woesebacteria bacterium RBG_16_34_12]
MHEKIAIREICQDWFEKILPTICDRETSQDATGWTKENPLWGHCAVVTLIAQDIWGGKLLRASLENIPGFQHFRSHYWNLLPTGIERDFTRSQFGDSYPLNLTGVERNREYVLSFPETAKRYELLQGRLKELLQK